MHSCLTAPCLISSTSPLLAYVQHRFAPAVLDDDSEEELPTPRPRPRLPTRIVISTADTVMDEKDWAATPDRRSLQSPAESQSVLNA